MRLPTKNIISKGALYYAQGRIWESMLAGFGVFLGWYLTKKCSSRTEVFLEIPVYFIESRKDLSRAWPVFEGSAKLLNAVSPFWAKEAKNTFKYIMVRDIGPMCQSDRRQESWNVNPLRFSSSQADAIVVLTMNLISALTAGILYRGRFGYLGVKKCRAISLRAATRFLRKCNSDGQYSDFLSSCYQQIDQDQPGRRYYEQFKLEESREMKA